MFSYENAAASKQLAKRSVTFKKKNGYVTPDKLLDRHTLILAGFKKTSGNEQWFYDLIDSPEYQEHFDQYTLVDWDDICPEDTPAPSPLMERVWNAFTY